MFHFPSFASSTYGFSWWYLPYSKWVPPFRHRRILGYLPPPRRFSQAITSFFASDCQGIHRMHFFTWLYNPKWAVCLKIHSYQNAWFSVVRFNHWFDHRLNHQLDHWPDHSSNHRLNHLTFTSDSIINLLMNRLVLVGANWTMLLYYFVSNAAYYAYYTFCWYRSYSIYRSQ